MILSLGTAPDAHLKEAADHIERRDANVAGVEFGTTIVCAAPLAGP